MIKYWILTLIFCICGFAATVFSFSDKQEVAQKTDGPFVGSNALRADNTYFATDQSDKEWKSQTDPAFLQENANVVKDGIFMGEDVHQKTDNSFVGAHYGKS